MGGSGGSSFHWPSREEIRTIALKAEENATNSAFGTEISTELGKLLAAYNDRDTTLVSKRLDRIRNLLEQEIETSIDVLYGGSVAKHTYVDGLSDIDTLFVLKEHDKLKPQELVEHFKSLIANRLSNANVTAGHLAVTVEYPDGMVIQCLPAIRPKDALKIAASSDPTKWAAIDPEAFQKALSRRNQECGNKLVPTIKLAKAINAKFPPDLQLSGYHIESMAIAAFRGYEKEYTTVSMLSHFFDQAANLVLDPIRDSSGQSVHVDGYLGKPKNLRRREISHVLSRTSRRMRNATANQDIALWKSLFE